MLRKPKILYYSNGQTQKEKAIEKAAKRLGADFISISETDCTQTVGYLAKVKGFPVHKTSILENISAVCQDVKHQKKQPKMVQLLILNTVQFHLFGFLKEAWYQLQ